MIWLEYEGRGAWFVYAAPESMRRPIVEQARTERGARRKARRIARQHGVTIKA